MDDSFGSTASVVSSSKARKRIRQESKWRANIAKQMRSETKGPSSSNLVGEDSKDVQCETFDSCGLHAMAYIEEVEEVERSQKKVPLHPI
ncbi:hypothetical protein J6590_087557 [Homalodisca vitripennis]|nr:hypothetical protein J6590_087557 [Homalodisca vitripennis]